LATMRNKDIRWFLENKSSSRKKWVDLFSINQFFFEIFFTERMRLLNWLMFGNLISFYQLPDTGGLISGFSISDKILNKLRNWMNWRIPDTECLMSKRRFRRTSGLDTRVFDIRY
jgi:hypothetical protein